MASLEEELDLARLEGVTHPANRPYLLQPAESNGQGVLLVHGFSATPHELRELGEHLREQSFTVFGVRLPGHGTSPEDLRHRRLEEWLAACERGYQILSEGKLSISGVGLSTGALLLLKLALQSRFERLVLLSPYLKLMHPLADLAGPLGLLIPYHTRTISEAERPYYYQRRPLKGVLQINRLRRHLKNRLSQVDCPTLVLAASGDKTVAPGTGQALFNRLGSQLKEFHLYGEEVPHVLTAAANPQQRDVFARTQKFLQPDPNKTHS